MLFVCLVVNIITIATAAASSIRSQTPSWSTREPIRVICPEGKGKGRCYDYCFNKAQITTIKWLDNNCLPYLEYDDAFMIERRREYISQWAYVASDPSAIRLYIDFRNTSLHEEVIMHPENVVRFLLVSEMTKASMDAGSVSVWDPSGLTEEQKNVTYYLGDKNAMGLTMDVVSKLPSLLHPEYTEIYSYGLGMQRYANNLTQALIWHWTDFPQELVIDIASSISQRIHTAPYMDVTERLWIRQLDKCQAYPDCESCSAQVNCDWCLIANLTYSCRGFCTAPWREDKCGDDPLIIISLITTLISLLFIY